MVGGAAECCLLARYTAPWFLRELLSELRIDPEYKFSSMFEQATRGLSSRSMVAQRDQSYFAVVIDEADHIVGNSEVLETIRDLSDLIEVPMVLVGMGKIRSSLTRFPQIQGRTSPVEFQPLGLSDVEALVSGLCEVPVAADLVALIYASADGMVREIKEALAHIERWGKRNPGVTASRVSMAGQILLHDRKTGREVLVRE